MKKIISVTIEEDLIKWLDSYCHSSTQYRNKSHLVEVAIETLKEKELKQKKK